MLIVCVIPAYRAASTIGDVVIGASKVCDEVIVIDDRCPESSGMFAKKAHDKTIVISRKVNGGVGAATKDGIRKALDMGAEIIVKIDADGQMAPELIPLLVAPLKADVAGFSKGTRFDNPEDLVGMPKVRILGNAALSLINKFSTGYWTVNDPTNGFLAMRGSVAKEISWEKIDDGYFFESDLLFRLRLIGVRISQMRMKSAYKGEHSGLRPFSQILPFSLKHLRNQAKRFSYLYLIREWNLGTVYILASFITFVIGVTAGISTIFQSQSGPIGTGTALLSSLGLILSVQFSTAFFTFDVTSEPK